MCAWGFHWFPWGQHLQRKKANFGCVLIQCCQKRTLFYPDTIYAELKCYPPLSPLKIERIWSTMLLCVLALSWYWLVGGFPVDVPNSQQWFVTNCHNGPKDMSGFEGSNNWYWQKHFPGQFVGPRPLHGIACSRIRFLFLCWNFSMPHQELERLAVAAALTCCLCEADWLFLHGVNGP